MKSMSSHETDSELETQLGIIHEGTTQGKFIMGLNDVRRDCNHVLIFNAHCRFRCILSILFLGFLAMTLLIRFVILAV